MRRRSVEGMSLVCGGRYSARRVVADPDEKADAPHPLGLLRARRERPCRRRAAEQRDEVAARHSITCSARAISIGGTVRASALAALRLMNRSNLVGCWTGNSAGLGPLTIRPAHTAARAYACDRL